ncbi:SMP-30/gluconolactonase/LRE family protein [Rheinheimera oceanensis]|uniref:SMP-30/gluconolactonase/LRE family protein n=1 Tax=Rheinheimera oceanensis TaxID=2817449 RepID=UPI001BFD2072|nr:SMP-30/gluconolactonase/LRE family protein [Rheinheimera oceanensis]
MANSENLQLLASISVKNRLGEGIFWHAASSSVWWTDIHGKALFQLRWPEQTLRQWPLPERISCFTLLNAADPMASRYPLLVTFASGFALYNPDSGATLWLAKPQQQLSGNRFNDGRVDRQGRFWAGTMVEQSTEDTAASGSLYRLDQHGCQQILSGLRIPNALCWNRDSRVMYHADSPLQQINRYRFDAASGDIGRAERFATVPQGSEPDGAIIDADDHLLCALWGGSALARYAADGSLAALYSLPVSQPTCVALGGDKLDILFVTTATEGLSAEQLSQQPQAGNLLVYQYPHQGLTEPQLAVMPWQQLAKRYHGGAE